MGGRDFVQAAASGLVDIAQAAALGELTRGPVTEEVKGLCLR